MEVTVSQIVTYEGFTYQPGTYEVDSRLAGRLCETFPNVISPVSGSESPVEEGKSPEAKSTLEADRSGVPEDTSAREEVLSVESAGDSDLEFTPVVTDCQAESAGETKLSEIEGFGHIEAFAEAGIETLKDFCEADDEYIIKNVSGVGKVTLGDYRELVGE